MTDPILTALRAWDGADLHPGLVLALRDPDAEPERAELSRLLLDGLARPRTVHDTILELVENGEYAAAEDVLSRAPDREQHLLADRIERAKRDWDQHVQLRMVALHARARHINATMPALDSATLAGRTIGSQALDQIEEEIAAAEGHMRDELESMLAQNEPEGRHGAVVRRCIRHGQFQAARFIIDAGEVHEGDASKTTVAESWPSTIAGRPTVLPAAVPQPSEWPWASGVEEVLGWIEQVKPAPHTFAEMFAPPAEDVAATALLRLMARGEDAGPAWEEAIDAFVGVRHVGSGLSALDDPLLVPLKGLSRRTKVVLTASEDATDQSVVLAPADILAMLPDPRTRRVALLRSLGSQLTLGDAIDRTATLEPDQISGVDELRDYVDWLLDILGVLTTPTVPEVVVWLAAGRAQLVLVLLAEILRRHGGRGRRIEVAQVLMASASAAFRSSIREQLASETQDDADVSAALWAAYWLDPLGRQSFSAEELVDACELCDTPLHAERAAQVLKELVEHGLTEEAEDGYRLGSASAVLLQIADDDMDRDSGTRP